MKRKRKRHTKQKSRQRIGTENELKNKETTTIMVLRQFRHKDTNTTIKTLIFEMLTEKMFYIGSWQRFTSKLGQK